MILCFSLIIAYRDILIIYRGAISQRARESTYFFLLGAYLIFSRRK